MKEQFYFFISGLFLLYNAIAQVPSYMFAYSFGDNSQDQGMSVTRDAAGNSYITGNFSGVVDFDPSASTASLAASGFSDIFIAKYNSAGQYQWAIHMGGATVYNSGTSIVTDAAGNVFVTGYFGDVADFDPSAATATLAGTPADIDVFLAKYNTNGQYQWAVAFQGPGNASGNSLALSQSGNVVVAGKFQSYADFDGSSSTLNLTSAGSEDIFVAQYSSLGNFISAFNVGGAGDDHCNSVTTDVSGNIIITGGFDQSVDFDPGSGVTMLLPTPGLNGVDIFLAKYSSSNNMQWAINMGSAGNDEGYSVNTDAGGNCYVTGFYSGTAVFDPSTSTNTLSSAGANDIFFAKYNSTGDYLWSQSLGGPGNDNSRSVKVDNSGFIYLTGNFDQAADFDGSASSYTLNSLGLSDIFLSKYTNSGTLMWAFSAGGTGADLGFDMAISSTGSEVYCTGIYQNTVDFDPSSSTANLTFNGVEDAFLARYTDLTVNIKTIQNNLNVSVYPNPFSSRLNIHTTETSELELYNSLGQLVLKKTIPAGTNEFYFENTPNGAYSLEIKNESGTATYKLIKNN